MTQATPPATPWPARICAAAALLALPLGGCIVDSSYGRCSSDTDCLPSETCEASTGQCYVQCNSDRDCYVNNAPVGKTCQQNHCVFSFSQGVKAPNFCLDVANPKSAHHGKELCLSDLKGKVVFIYFGMLG